MPTACVCCLAASRWRSTALQVVLRCYSNGGTPGRSFYDCRAVVYMADDPPPPKRTPPPCAFASITCLRRLSRGSNAV